MKCWRITLVFVLALFVFDACAIKCYNCRSENGQCKTGECSAPGGVCTKREKNYGNGTWTVIKTCRSAPVINLTCEYDQSLAPGGQICFCDSYDFCNAAHRSAPYFHGTLPVLIILVASIPVIAGH